MNINKILFQVLFATFCIGYSVPVYSEPTEENTPDYFVEWVRSKSNLYVDTGVIGKVGVKAEISFYHESTNEPHPILLGSWSAVDLDRFHLVMHTGDTCRWEYGSYEAGKYSEPAATGMVSNDGAKINANSVYGSFRNVVVECRADGSMESVWSGANGSSIEATMNASEKYGLLDTKTTLYLFASHLKYGNTDKAVQFSKTILRSCRLWTDYEGSGTWTLVRDFRPCVKNGRAGLYDAVNEVIHYPQGNELVSGPVTLERGHRLGANAQPATQWGRIAYGKDRGDMGNYMYIHSPLNDYTFKGEGDTLKLNGANNEWQGKNLKQSQLRYDGWFYVSEDKAGEWTVNQAFDDYFALFVDGVNIIANKTYIGSVTGKAIVAEGWHRFTIIAGDTYGGYGSSRDYFSQGWWPFGITVNGNNYVFKKENFPQGSELNKITLQENTDWSELGPLILDGGTILDLNGYSLTVKDIACDNYVGSYVTNSANNMATLIFAENPLSSKAYADGLIKEIDSKIIIAGGDYSQKIVWTGAANDGGNALTPNNWKHFFTGESIVPTSLHDVYIIENAEVNLQIPAGSAFSCKSFNVGDCKLVADCDWSGLSVKPSMSGNLNLDGHSLVVNNAEAKSGAVISGIAGSQLRINVPEGEYKNLGEGALIDNLANLSVAQEVKIVLTKSESGTVVSDVIKFGMTPNAEFIQNGGAISLTGEISGIGVAANNIVGSGVWRMNGGTIKTTNSKSEFRVGSSGRGEFIQTAGDVNLCNWFSIGRFANSAGTYTITGGTLSAIKNERPTWIAGDNGATGTLNIGGNASIILNGIRMGGDENKAADRKAYVNISENGSLTVEAGGFQVGTYSNSKGTVFQDGGTVKCQSWLAIGRYPNSVGLYSLTGGNLDVIGDNAGLAVGEQGTGTLEIGGKAVVNARVVSISHQSGGVGTLKLKEGGTIVTPSVKKGAGNSATAFFDGGTLKAAGNGTLIQNIGNLVFGKSLEFDTDGYDVSMSGNVVASGYGPGKLVKSGEGSLSFGALSCAGTIDVQKGTLALTSDNDNTLAATLAHRWSFENDLTDSITGKKGAKYGNGAAVFENGEVKLSGGGNGNCYIDLGIDKLPSDKFTIEMWVTLRELKEWARCMVVKSENPIVFTSRRSKNEGNYCCNFDSCGEVQKTEYELKKDKQYYVAISYENNGSGGVIVKQYLKESGAENFLWTNTYTKDSYSLPVNVTAFWLAHSSDGTGDLKADYAEVRVWNGALTKNQISFSSLAGPNAKFGILSLAPVAKLDLAGHTLKQPIVKASGLIETGDGELVVTEKVSVKSGECLEASGTIDISSAKIELENDKNSKGSVIFIKPVSGKNLTVVGEPSAANVTEGWLLIISDNGECRLVKKGMALFVR
jgi:hypothetical protein